jgi:hypothetical protein
VDPVAPHARASASIRCLKGNDVWRINYQIDDMGYRIVGRGRFRFKRER